jgi:hypothetical protein
MTKMKTIQHLVYLALLAVAVNAQTPTQMDVSRVKGAAQLGSDGKVLSSQLPPSGTNGGSGASQTAQLLDWQFTRVSATQLSCGSSCLPSSPCNVDIGGTVTQFANGPYLINLAGANAAGSICVYITPANTLTVGVGNGLTTANISGSNSLAITGNVNSCPQDAAKLERWDVSAAAFVSTGYAFASYLSYKPSPLAGTGIQVTAGQRDVIQIDTGSVLRKFTCAGGPVTALPAGATQGDICWDFNSTPPGKYVCANAAGCAAAGDWKVF